MKRYIVALIGCQILLLIALGFFLGLQQAGAVSTMNGVLHQVQIDCNNCHTLNNTEAAPGTMGIKQSASDEVVFPASHGTGDAFPCEFCHRTAGGFPDTPNTNYDKQLGFDSTFMKYDTTYKTQKVSHAPSGHPVTSYKYRLNQDGYDNDGDGVVDEIEADGTPEIYNPVIFCTNCHDRGTAVYPVHEFANSQTGMASIQARLLVRSVSPLFDPDPWDNTVAGVGSYMAWNTYHDPGTPPPVIDYANNPGEANPALYPFYASNFCLTCHDSDGFPANPYAASEADTYRITAKSSFNSPQPGQVPDVKSLWDDMGHYIQSNTGVILKQGDKIPCSVCHYSHYSANSVSLLSDVVIGDMTRVDASTHTPIQVCLNCHDKYHDLSSDPIVGIPMLAGINELVPPLTHGGRDIDGHQPPMYGYRSSCLGSFEVQNPLNNGCHMSPHAPRADCGGCHPDQARGGTIATKVIETRAAARQGRVLARGVSQDYYSSHPINISLDLDDPDIQAIKEFYLSRPERLQSPDPAPLGVNNSVYCTTCHNNHGDVVNSSSDNVVANDGKRDDQAVLHLGYPWICLQCHERIWIRDGQGGMRPLKNAHGGFAGSGGSGSGTGMCNKCHSMHGRHPYSGDPNNPSLEYKLHYGMFGSYDTTWERIIDLATGVYRDITDVQYYKANNSHLIHYPTQELLCGRCHGTEPPPTGNLIPRPPNVFFPHETNNYSKDTYYRDENWTTRANATHPIDEGTNTPWGEPVNVQLRCGSCHNPHGSDNYKQLRDRVKVGMASVGTEEVVRYVTGIRVNAIYDATYRKKLYYRTELGANGQPASRTDGMSQFCEACHTGMAQYFFDTARFDTTIYMRHPMNSKVSRLNVTIYNFDKLVLQNKTITPNDGEIFCMTCHQPHGSDTLRLSRFREKTESCQLYCHVEIVEK